MTQKCKYGRDKRYKNKTVCRHVPKSWKRSKKYLKSPHTYHYY